MKKPVNLRTNLHTGVVKRLTFQMLLDLECKIENAVLIKIDNGLCKKYTGIHFNLYQDLIIYTRRFLNKINEK
jgi:hypothetical protein